MTDRSYQTGQYLPPVARPQGMAYMVGTWSGRILLLNTAVFLVMALLSGNLFMPSDDVLLVSGIKEPDANPGQTQNGWQGRSL